MHASVTMIAYRMNVATEMAMLLSATDKRAASDTRNLTATCRVIVHCLCEGQSVLDYCAELLVNLTN